MLRRVEGWGGVGRSVGLLAAAWMALAVGVRAESGRAPRLSLEGGTAWINSDGPIHLEKLRGKVVVLDFWTYCCINCHHVLPDLASLEKKYKNQVVVIGVHSGKFAAEKETENIRQKVREYGIRHPVVNDADGVIKDRFGFESWPTIAVINANGDLVDASGGARDPYIHGEGHGVLLDKVVGELVARHKARRELDETPIEFPAESEKPHELGLLYPGKITADLASNRLYISDTGHNRIVVTDLDGRFVEAIGSGKPGLVEGDFASAGFNRPQGTCLLDGVLFVADTENHALRAVDLDAKSVKTVAGTGKQGGYNTPPGRGTSTPLDSPWDVLALPGVGNRMIAIAMAGSHQIWRYDTSKGTVSHWAGSGRENVVDGTLASSQFAQPSGLATDGQHLFVADSEVSGVRSIALGAQHRVGTIVGIGLFDFGDEDGQGSAVRLQHCLGLAYGDGKLYIADTYNNKIKVCDPRTRTVKALVGDRKRGSTDEPAGFDEPGGLSLAGRTLYVADTNNHAIRAVDLALKAVRTLDLSTVKPPSVEKAPRFSNPLVIEVAPVRAIPGKELTLDVSLALPPGYKLSAEAPLAYLVESDPSGAFAAEVSPVGTRLERPSKEFSIKLPLARQAPAGSTLRVKVSVSAFVCLPNSLCTVKNYAWNVPITFAPGAPAVVRLTSATQ